MPIITQCDSCGKKFRIPDHHAGTFLPCKNCGEDMFIDDGGTPTLPRYGSNGGQSSSSSGVPTWAIGAGVGGAVVVLLLIFVLLRGSSSSDQNNAPSQQVAQSNVPPPRPNIGNNTRPGQPTFNTPNSTSRTASNKNTTRPQADGFSESGDSEYPGSFGNESDSSVEKPGSTTNPLTQLKNQLRGLTEPSAGSDDKPSVSAPAGWRATADPPPEELTLNPSEKVDELNIKLGRGISKEILMPKSYSPLIAFQLDSSFVVYDTRSGSRKSKSRIKFDFFAKPAMSPMGGYFATTIGTFGKDGVAVYDVEEKESLGTIFVSDVQQIMFPDEKHLLAIGENETKLIEIPSGKTISEPPVTDIGNSQTAITPGGKYLSVLRLESSFGKRTPEIKTYDLENNKELPTLKGPQFDLFSADADGLAFSPDGRQLAAVVTAREKGRVFVWNFETGELVHDITLTEEFDRFTDIVGFGDSVQPGIGWFPDLERLLIKGHGVVDISVGQFVYLLPRSESGTSFRWPVSGSQVVGIAGDFQGASLLTVDLPVELFNKARDVIAQGGLAIDAVLPPIKKANVSTGIPLQLPTGAWSVKPDPAPVSEESLIRKTLEFELPSREGYFSQFFLSDAAGGKALIARKTQENRFRFHGEPIVFNAWVDVYDLAKGREQGSLELPYPADAIAFSPSGNLVATRDAERQDRLDLWNPEEEAHHVAFRPFQDVPPGERFGGKVRSDYGEYVIGSQQIAAVRFLDDEHVLTLSGEKRLRAWKLPECELIYEIQKIGVPGISPGSGLLAIQDSDHVMIFESRTGKPLGLLSAPGEMTAASFHIDGKTLAVTVVRGADNFLYVWNLESGEQTASFPLPRPTSSLKFADQNHILLDDRYLVDIPSEAVAWNYEFPEQAIIPFSIDDRILYLGPLNARQPTIYLAAVKLPEESILQRISSASLSSDSISLSGKSVSLISNISGAGGGEKGKGLNENATAHYEDILQKQGAITKPNGRFQLVLSTQEKGGRTVTYRTRSDPFSGSPFGPSLFQQQDNNTESANVKNVTCSISIEEDGLPVWQTSSTFSNYSMFVMYPKGSSIQSTLDSQLSGSIGSYFMNTPIPTFVFPPGAEAGLGRSRLNEEGVITE